MKKLIRFAERAAPHLKWRWAMLDENNSPRILQLEKRGIPLLEVAGRAREGRLEEHLSATEINPREHLILSPVDPESFSSNWAVGLNFGEHAEQSGMPKPAHPVWFPRANEIYPAYQHVVCPERDPREENEPVRFDYEVELEVIIGQHGVNVPVEEALNYVLGYAVGNDWSARTRQFRGSDWAEGKLVATQWSPGKILPLCFPVGPIIAIREDGEADPKEQNWGMRLAINGEERQVGSTRDMIFSVAQLVSDMSYQGSLTPGMVITTGTPPGCCFQPKKPKLQAFPYMEELLDNGETVTATLSIDGLGEQSQLVVQRDGSYWDTPGPTGSRFELRTRGGVDPDIQSPWTLEMLKA